jgi:hypothetical protein
MNGVTLKAVDPTAEDHLVGSPEIAAIPGETAELAWAVIHGSAAPIARFRPLAYTGHMQDHGL